VQLYPGSAPTNYFLINSSKFNTSLQLIPYVSPFCEWVVGGMSYSTDLANYWIYFSYDFFIGTYQIKVYLVDYDA
jgi:hypothetical protein